MEFRKFKDQGNELANSIFAEYSRSNNIVAFNKAVLDFLRISGDRDNDNPAPVSTIKVCEWPDVLPVHKDSTLTIPFFIP